MELTTQINDILESSEKDSSDIVDYLLRGNQYVQTYNQRLNNQLRTFSSRLLEFSCENEKLRYENNQLKSSINKLKRKKMVVENDNKKTHTLNQELYDSLKRLRDLVSNDESKSDLLNKWVDTEYTAKLEQRCLQLEEKLSLYSTPSSDLADRITSDNNTTINNTTIGSSSSPKMIMAAPTIKSDHNVNTNTNYNPVLSQATTIGPSEDSASSSLPNSSPIIVKEESIDYQPHLPSQLSPELSIESINLDLSQYQKIDLTQDYEGQINDKEEVLSSPKKEKISTAFNLVTPKETPRNRPLNKRRKPNFNDEIDEDLTTARKAVMFQDTPISNKSGRTLDSWLGQKKKKKEDKTPTRRPLQQIKINESNDDKEYNTDEDNEFLDNLCKREWHQNDFGVNEKHNDGYKHAYQETVRGKKRQCEHGKGCEDCSEFHKIAGNGIEMNGVGGYKVVNVDGMIENTSRHRDRFSSQDTPPGYYRPDMPTTQEEEQYKAQQKAVREEEAKKRFQEAIKCGKWQFRNKQIKERVEKIYNKRN